MSDPYSTSCQKEALYIANRLDTRTGGSHLFVNDDNNWSIIVGQRVVSAEEAAPHAERWRRMS